MTDDQIKQLIRRVESMEKTLNLIYKDRDIMEETHIRTGVLDDRMKAVEERMGKLEKRLTADSNEVKESVTEVKDLLTN